MMWGKMQLFSAFYSAGIVTLLCDLHSVESCNESMCASVVSKCLLNDACDCDMADIKNCACCRDCQKCLSKLYTECCSCVGLCKAPNHEENLQGTSSSMEKFKEPIPDLFNVLTEEYDFEERWVSFSYPVRYDDLSSGKEKFAKITSDTYDGNSINIKELSDLRRIDFLIKGLSCHEIDSAPNTELFVNNEKCQKDGQFSVMTTMLSIFTTSPWNIKTITVSPFEVGSRDKDRMDEITDPEQNCTVAFMSQCLSLHKCKNACLSMGAARYRWFHDHGCCQCIGSTCISYGKNSPHCLKCPDEDDQDDNNDDNLNNAVNDLPDDNDDDDDDDVLDDKN